MAMSEAVLLAWLKEPGDAVEAGEAIAEVETDKSVLEDYPRGPGSDLLNQLMSDSIDLFHDHPVNEARRKQGKPPATNIWLWGQGRTPAIRPMDDHQRFWEPHCQRHQRQRSPGSGVKLVRTYKIDVL